MPMMTTGQPESDVPALHERRHFIHKRLERWIRLQQFVYGLPEEYAYAVRSSREGDRTVSRALVNVGWMTWFGVGRGTDRQHALALALLGANDAWSANGTRVFFHELSRWFGRRFLPKSLRAPGPSEADWPRQDKMAS